MTHDHEQVERVAQAIRDRFLRRQLRGIYAGRPWGEIPEALRDQFRDEARGAIEAMQ